jgi:hypothetical protein
MSDRFGSLTDIHCNNSSMSAVGRIAVTQQPNFEGPRPNVCFHRKRSFRPPDIDEFEGQLTARSGRLDSTGRTILAL